MLKNNDLLEYNKKSKFITRRNEASKFLLINIGFAIIILFLALISVLPQVGDRFGDLTQKKEKQESLAAGNTLIVGNGDFSTINTAVAAAAFGDTISIKTGIYNETVTANKALTFQAYGDGPAVIDRNCSSSSGPGIKITASGVTIRGLTVRNTVEAAILIDGTTSSGKPNSVTIDGNTLQNFDCKFIAGSGDPSSWGQYHAGVASWYGGSSTTIINNVIEHRTSGDVHGSANGIWFKSTSGSPSGGGHLISGNTIIGGWDGIGGEAEGDVHGNFDKNTTVENNTISNCWDDGIQAEGGDENVYIKNNDIQSCGTGIALAAPQTGPIYVENNSITNLRRGLYDNLFCYKVGNSGSGDIYLTGNTCRVDSATEISQGGADGILQTNPNFSNKLILRDNIFRTSRYIYSITQNPIPTGTTFSHNCLSTTDSDRFVKWAGGVYYTSLASFQSATGQEQNSQQTTDCSFLDVGGDPLDSDGDGYSDQTELYLGTNPDLACGIDAWPPDFDNNQVINTVDIYKLLPPTYGTTVPSPTPYRYDLVPDGVINTTDVYKVLPPYYGTSCIPEP